MAEVYTYGPNDWILTAGNRSYVTDNNGNVTSVTVNGQTTSLTYDFENRVTRFDFPHRTHSTFNYNGLGLRLRKGGSGGNTQYYVDGWTPGPDLIADSSATFQAPQDIQAVD